MQPNTCYQEGGNPVIETPLSAARALLDMALQSWGGKIRIFPAIPGIWRDFAFDNLLAEGAFEVSAVRGYVFTVWRENRVWSSVIFRENCIKKGSGDIRSIEFPILFLAWT